MFRRRGGKYVTREMQCDCGKVFEQFQISKRFVELMGERAANIFRSYSPEGYVPLYCPKCERKKLGQLPPSQP